MTSIALKDLDHLQHLDMSFNKLTQLLDNQFALIGSIETINVSHNRLHSIQPFTFAELASLQTLDLSSNRLESGEFLESAAFKVVDLRYNAYEHIDLSALGSIERLILSNNPWNCTWLLNAMANSDNTIANIRFGVEFSGEHDNNHTKSSIEEIECIDHRNTIERSSARRIFIVNFNQCANQKSFGNNQKVFIHTIYNECERNSINKFFFFFAFDLMFSCRKSRPYSLIHERSINY